MYLALSIFCLSPCFAGEILQISAPYLPEQLDYFEDNDLISNIILKNTSSKINTVESDELNPARVKKIIRTNLDNNQVWDLEYSSNTSLNYAEKLTEELIKNSIEYAKKHSSKDISTSLNNIENTLFYNTINGFMCRFILRQEDPGFIKNLSKVPLINNKIANIFGTELGKGTNQAVYGHYTIKEANPESHISLTKNNYFGTNSNTDSVQEIIIKKISDPEARIRQIRSGSSAIIVAPTIQEIEEAKNDPTLLVIDSPFSKKEYRIMADKDNNYTYDLQHIIIRKALNLDKNFFNNFELHGIDKTML